MRPTIDERDVELIARRAAALDDDPDFRIGDYVEFADGVTRRISMVYPREWGDMWGAQTSEGGSYYLGGVGRNRVAGAGAYVSYSGSLHPAVSGDTLTLTEERRPGRVWIFHHDHWTAGNGVEAEIPFRVYRCSQEATR